MIHDLAAQDADVSDKVWGPSEIETTALKLPGDALARVFGPAPTDRSLEALRYDRLGDVLRSIKRLPPPPIAEIRPVSVEKLEVNAFSEDVLYLLRRGRRKEALVATLLGHWPKPGFAEELAEGFRRRYAELKALPGITGDEILGSLQDHTRGSEPLSDPGHQAAVLAVLSYFFERCDIFEERPRWECEFDCLKSNGGAKCAAITNLQPDHHRCVPRGFARGGYDENPFHARSTRRDPSDFATARTTSGSRS